MKNCNPIPLRLNLAYCNVVALLIKKKKKKSQPNETNSQPNPYNF